MLFPKTHSLVRLLAGVGALFVSFSVSPSAAAAETTSSTIAVDRVWSGHPVAFCLLTHKQKQYVAYYDAERRMTVASRPLSSTRWEKLHLPEKIKWDSHNYVTMTFDDDDHLHLSGNMHNRPLVYFRTTRPQDITSLERVTSMTGTQEKRCTYPRFFRGPAQELLFTYRDGGSGNGSQIYNVYDHSTRSWRRLLDSPLTDGQGQMSAYLHGPRRGPDGYFHLVWVWRDTPDCATNHHLSYARSRNLVNWQTSTGTQLALPITFATSEVVDPTPPGGGLLNGLACLGFDSDKRPVISYHKYDAGGRSQIWNARLEDGSWRIVQATDWEWRFDFSGGGTIGFPMSISPVKRGGKKGELTMKIKHPHQGGTWTVDEQTLRLKERVPESGGTPAQLLTATSSFAGMQGRVSGDTGKSSEPGVRYLLRWETLPANRDLEREGPLPEPSLLEVVRLERTDPKR